MNTKTTPPLQAFLEFNIRYVEEAAKEVKPGGDLQPMLAFYAGGELHMALLKLANKDAEMQAAKHLMQQMGATMYALIAASWTVALPDGPDRQRLHDLFQRHGSAHPELRPLRREIYSISVGDKNGTLMACLFVERDAEGRIAKLRREDRKNAEQGILTGRMVDLLAEPAA